MAIPSVPGRGAWSQSGKLNGTVRYAYIAGKPLDGDRPLDNINTEAVHYGVRAIQARLNELVTTVTDIPVDGVFGPTTDKMVRAFQQQSGLVVDGQVGIITARALWRSLVTLNGRKYNFDPRYLWGQMLLESAGDPGAVGSQNNGDKGLVQINLPSHPSITIEQAFDSHFALDFSAKNFAAALDKYSSKPDRQLNASVARHNSPLWAGQYWNTGVWPNNTIQNYVKLVLQNAATY